MDYGTLYPGDELMLKANREKSTGGNVYKSKFLGFSFRLSRKPGKLGQEFMSNPIEDL
jgi:hypothetical protein